MRFRSPDRRRAAVAGSDELSEIVLQFIEPPAPAAGGASDAETTAGATGIGRTTS